MGLMRFVISPAAQLSDEAVEQAYLTGFDRSAWQVQVTREGDELLFRRGVADSGNLHIPWEVEGHGRPTLSTASLCESAGPFQLPLELARGTLSQLRNQLADWRAIGLVVPEKVDQLAAQSLHHFGRAAVGQEDRQASGESAQQAIREALDAGALLAATYVDQAITVRRRGGGKLSSWLGAQLGVALLNDYAAKQFLLSFSAAGVPLRWRDVEASEGTYHWDVCDQQIEWCRTNKLKVCAGPLLQLDPHAMPDWLYLWEDDFDNLLSFASEYVSTAVARYRGKVDLWQCAARVNSAEVLSLSEEDTLRMAARTIELTRRGDPDTPVMISFDQPWTEYMSRRPLDFPPLQFADALLRAGLELSGIMLEMNLGYYPNGTLPRTPLEFSSQLDYWSVFGLPLFVSISAPSGYHEDPLARQNVAVSHDWTERTQQAWVAQFVPLILAKPYVRGIFWNQLSDGQPHDFPHAGLFDERANAKPALRTLASIRHRHLEP